MASEETRRSRSPKKNRGINWTDEATEALLELWPEESIQMSLEHSKSSKETGAVYENLRVTYIIVVWVHYRSYREITLIPKSCNLLKNIAVRSTFQCIVHGDNCVNLRYCVLQYVIYWFLSLVFCMYVTSNWKIEILKVTQSKIWWIRDRSFITSRRGRGFGGVQFLKRANFGEKCTKCEGGRNFKTQDWHYML